MAVTNIINKVVYVFIKQTLFIGDVIFGFLLLFWPVLVLSSGKPLFISNIIQIAEYN